MILVPSVDFRAETNTLTRLFIDGSADKMVWNKYTKQILLSIDQASSTGAIRMFNH